MQRSASLAAPLYVGRWKPHLESFTNALQQLAKQEDPLLLHSTSILKSGTGETAIQKMLNIKLVRRQLEILKSYTANTTTAFQYNLVPEWVLK